MKKDAYYFPHFSNARNDSKILKIRRILGIEGYGIYFMLLEVLREQTEYKLPLSSIEDLSYEWHTSKEKIITIINDFELFDIIDNLFFSPKLILYLQPYMEKSQRAQTAALKRWDNAKALQMQCQSNASKVKESKVKEINKVKENKESKELSWKTDFEIYKSELRTVFNQLVNDDEFLQSRQKYHPGVNIALSIEKACIDFWATEQGWIHKRKSKVEVIDWKKTLINAIDMNKVYFDKTKNGDSNYQLMDKILKENK